MSRSRAPTYSVYEPAGRRLSGTSSRSDEAYAHCAATASSPVLNRAKPTRASARRRRNVTVSAVSLPLTSRQRRPTCSGGRPRVPGTSVGVSAQPHRNTSTRRAPASGTSVFMLRRNTLLAAANKLWRLPAPGVCRAQHARCGAGRAMVTQDLEGPRRIHSLDMRNSGEAP